MEKETRTSKYKDYREAAKEGEDITVKQEEDSDDDFLSFIPRDENETDEEEELHPLSYDTLKDDDTVVQALKSVKAKNDYDTKMDILNRIKADTKENTPGAEDSQAPKTDEDVEAFKKKSEPVAKKAEKEEVIQPKPEIRETKAETKPENLNDIDLSSVSKKAVSFEDEEPVKLSRKEIKALKKQEKDEKKREKIEEKKQSENVKKAEVKPEPKPDVKVHNPRMEAKAEEKAVPVKKKPSVFSRILDFIVLILLIIVMIFIVITIMSII